MIKDTTRRERGSTLLEAMVVVGCLGILGKALLGVYSARQRFAADQSYLLRATSVMEGELEQLRRRPLSPLLRGRTRHSATFLHPELVLIPQATARRVLKVLPGDLVRVVLEVAWTSTTGQPKKVRLVSLLAKESEP